LHYLDLGIHSWQEKNTQLSGKLRLLFLGLRQQLVEKKQLIGKDRRSCRASRALYYLDLQMNSWQEKTAANVKQAVLRSPLIILPQLD
jgi:hypothetical protein